MTTLRDIAHMTWQEVDALDKRHGAVVLPLGSIEQHGPHLSVDCDLHFSERFLDMALERLPAGRRIPLELAENEVAVRVPIRVASLGRTRFFGDELVFRLEPAGARFEIAEISEDFRLP